MRPAPVPLQYLSKSFSTPRLYVSRRLAYSTSTGHPTIRVTDVPAPYLGHIRILSLNRPEARNAISRQLLAELTREIDAIHSEGDGLGPTRALVLASAVEGSFCAGADLKERRGMSREETTNFLTTLRNTFTRLSTLPIPTISALAAPALGGGLELALCTHLRIFSSSTIVGLPETRLAIVPGAGGTHRLPALIGASRARDLILTGRRVGALEALAMGLCERMVDVERDAEGKEEGKSKDLGAREKVLAEAVRMAHEICEGGPVATRAALGAIESAARGEGQEGENKWYQMVVGTEDRNEALRAFSEKRRPVYKGR